MLPILPGLCADLFAHVLLEHELLIGETVTRELRSKLRTKLKLSKSAIEEIEALLRDQVVVSTPQKHLGLAISDADDEWIVAGAMAGDADVLVTGDAALQSWSSALHIRSCLREGCGIGCAPPSHLDSQPTQVRTSIGNIRAGRG
jgi:putative PIN family toxin of toxin-antitoxin system